MKKTFFLTTIITLAVFLSGCSYQLSITKKESTKKQTGKIETEQEYGVYKKPAIYLYPKERQKTQIKLIIKGNLTVSDPKYDINNGWQVIAYPDGKIINIDDGKEYNYLFWEGIDKDANFDLSNGFIVEGSNTADFLQEKLSFMGLAPKEYNEFIMYWLPRMQNNKYNFIHFATKEEYQNRAILEINPKPDSVLRVFMVFKKIDNTNLKINPQQLPSFNRNGFAVIEWGGTEIK